MYRWAVGLVRPVQPHTAIAMVFSVRSIVLCAVSPMSTRRNSPGGWVSTTRLPKGPNGRALCRQCSTEVPVGRRTFCSTACVDVWRIRTDPGFLRLKVWERDHAICARCGVDSVATAPPWRNGSARKNRARGTGDLWQADHIVPVAEGGGECGIDNLRTLCTACHRAETAALRKRLAAAARHQKAQARPLPLFDTAQ